MSTKGRGPQVDPEGRGSSPTMKGLDPPRPFNNIRLPWAGRRKPPRRSLVQCVARRSCEGRVQKPGTCFAAPAQEWRRAAVLLEEVCVRMPTINQLIRKPRKWQVARNKVPAMEACPQKRGVCTRVYTTTPKKPTSPLRTGGRVP